MKQPDLGKIIQEFRIAKGLTQGELAKKCNLSLRTIQRIEAAEGIPRSQTIKLICSDLDYNFYSTSINNSKNENKGVKKLNILCVRLYGYALGGVGSKEIKY